MFIFCFVQFQKTTKTKQATYEYLIGNFSDCLSNNTNHSENLFYVSKLEEYHGYFELLTDDCVSKLEINYDDFWISAFEYETLFEFRDTNSYTCIDTTVPFPDEILDDNDDARCGCTWYWHLDAIDGNYFNAPNGLYNYISLNNPSDSNVDIYIVDSGILSSHNEFKSLIDDNSFERLSYDGDLYNEESITNDHGTHVAGIAAGITSGVAKNYDKLIDVPRCGYGGSTCGSQDADTAFELIISNLEKDYISINNRKRAVITMSWGGTYSSKLFESYNGIFEEITQLGGILVGASTNSNKEWNQPCDGNLQDGPAGANYVVTVGRHQYQSTVYNSGYGECIDIYGPGVNIMSATSDCDTCYTEKSGTSMATPAIAGLIANMLAYDDSLSFDEILSILKDSDGNKALSNCLSEHDCLASMMDCQTMVTLVDRYSSNTDTDTGTVLF